MQEFCAYEGRPCVDMKLSFILDCVQYSFPHVKWSVLIPYTKNVENLNFGCHLHEIKLWLTYLRVFIACVFLYINCTHHNYNT